MDIMVSATKERAGAINALPVAPSLDDLSPMVARLIRREGIVQVDIADPVALAAITRALRHAPGTQA